MIKLNIQRFADASKSITLSLRSDSYNPVRYVYFQVDQVGPNTFNWKVWNAKAVSYSAQYITAHQFHFWINGTEVWNMSGISGYTPPTSGGGDYLGYTHHEFPVTIDSNGVSGTYTSTGTPSGFNITAKAGYDSAGYVQEVTEYFTCARYNFSSTPSVSTQSKDENSITVKWNTSENCNRIKWYKDGVEVETQTVNGTTGTYTFTGLDVNTPYTLKGYFRRSDSGYEMYSTEHSTRTDNYPYVLPEGGLVPNIITLGQTVLQTVNISNPHNRQTTVYVVTNDVNRTQIGSATTTGTSVSIPIPFSDLYPLIPNSQSGTLCYYCVYTESGVDHQTTDVVGTYQINGSELPTFPTSNWSYVANLTSLTNDNQKIIDNYSTVTITVDTPASSNYNASISSYYATWGSVTDNTLTPSNPVSLTGGSGTSIVVLANDSRGLQSDLQASTLDVTANRILYNKPIVNTLETHRLNGIDTTVTLNATGTMFKGTFGENGVQNDIHHIYYYVKTINSSTWSQAYSISLNDCTFDSSTGQWEISNASIHANGTSGGFPSGSSYDVKLEFYDAEGLLGYGTLTSIIDDGTLARDVFKDYDGEYHEGINGLADGDYTQTIHGDINITGEYYKNGQLFTSGDTVPYGAIMDYDGNSVPSGYEEVAEISEVLWSGTPTASTITLTKATLEYKYVEIYGYATDNTSLYGNRVFTKTDNPSDCVIYLSGFDIDTTNHVLYLKNATCIINAAGTQISFASNYQWWQISGSSTGGGNSGNFIKIYKVVGYK